MPEKESIRMEGRIPYDSDKFNQIRYNKLRKIK